MVNFGGILFINGEFMLFKKLFFNCVFERINSRPIEFEKFSKFLLS